MSTISYPVRRPTPQPRAITLEQVLLAGMLGVVLFVVVLVIFFLGFQIVYAGRIFPGVSVAGIDVSGMTPREAAQEIQRRITYPQTGKLVLKDGERFWIVTPAELGLALDASASARAAFQIGRSGDPFTRLWEQSLTLASGKDVPPVLLLDQRVTFAYLNNLATQIDVPAKDATLQVEGTEVKVTPGQIGRKLDLNASLILVSVQMQTLKDAILNLYVQEEKPAILDASTAAEQARRILSTPLTLTLPATDNSGDGPWTIPPEQLAQMLVIRRAEADGNTRYQVGLNETYLLTYLSDLAPKLRRSPVNARFIFKDDTRQLEVIQNAVIGRELDVSASANFIQEKLAQGEHEIALQINYTNPPVTDEMTGEQLGITELVQATTTYFRGSSAARVQNIKAAASKFHGLLVAPGETFSMAQALGDITLDNGYAEALIIIGGQTIKGVGGGVCQVSTTLFRNAFFAGFPIVERHAHAYRVGYYEQTASGHSDRLAGLDATVFVPLVDFKFVNDTPYWLLMETYINGYSLTWKFYSTKDGRTVEWDTTGPTNVVDPPETVYRENPDLKQGEIKQVEWAAKGADVTVTRRVYKNGALYFSDQFVTHYEPWGEVFEYGPGTELPPKE
ncbi:MULTISPECIES: VanW family protein [Anaerolinea]|uniref:G5 domain-containing protein n=1 Tax=Anaerolinea thermophila (strain DSM 14523 / JCM 11388 / NBRC 100420 / UNI-1) TaxID=926569 RepID=E8N1Q0_ANATU|nr:MULTISPECIES: VanW family protein [Anaerolinea]BAJ62655.1 hypothetical protein ANT_06210 [Anaerolinea thermophila UNI-1]